MAKDLAAPSRVCVSWVRLILRTYVKDMINDNDYERVERELLDVIRSERKAWLRSRQRTGASR